MASSGKGAPVPPEGMLRGVRWSVADPLRTRPVAERRAARGGDVAHVPMNRGGLTERPHLEDALHPRQRPVWTRGRRAAPARTVQGEGPSRARGRHRRRDPGLAAPRPSRPRGRMTVAADGHPPAWRPETSTLDGREAKEAAMRRDTQAPGTPSALRQGTDGTKIVAPAHRAVTRLTRPLRGCQALTAAPAPLVGSALRPRSKTRPLGVEEGAAGRTAAALCDSRAASSLPQPGIPAPARSPEQKLRQNPTNH